MTQHRKPEQDRPADPSEETATDQQRGKTVRGWENIDKKGHDKGEGDEPEEREGQKGH